MGPEIKSSSLPINAIYKLSAGIAFIVLGIIGILSGKKLNSKPLRTTVQVFSVVSILGGIYLFWTGLTMQAYRQYGTPTVGEFTFSSPDEFKDRLLRYKETKAQFGKNVRRLHYTCKDGSEEFTIYFTKLGVLNVPEKDVVCNDNTYLVRYTGD